VKRYSWIMAVGYALTIATIIPGNLYESRFLFIVSVVSLAVTLIVQWKWTRLLRLKRRISGGLCPSCGYDLRATPERCPECGAVPKKFPVST
jgi:hypothetical protein